MIALINLLLLTALLYLWTDHYELLFNSGVTAKEFVKILGFTVLSLVVMCIANGFYENRNRKMKVSIAAALTLLVSSFLYVDYLSKIIDHKLINGEQRDLTADKITTPNPTKTVAKDLTITEYNTISKVRRLPELSPQATHINYSFEAEDFLSDYLLELSYNLPANVTVDTFYLEQGNFYKKQTFELSGSTINVHYTEMLQ